MQELMSLKKATRSNRRLETTSQGMIRGMREEVAELRRVQQEQQRETLSEPQQCLYPELHRSSSMIREFFTSVLEPYRLDKEASESSASVSGCIIRLCI